MDFEKRVEMNWEKLCKRLQAFHSATIGFLDNVLVFEEEVFIGLDLSADGNFDFTVNRSTIDFDEIENFTVEICFAKAVREMNRPDAERFMKRQNRCVTKLKKLGYKVKGLGDSLDEKKGTTVMEKWFEPREFPITRWENVIHEMVRVAIAIQ